MPDFQHSIRRSGGVMRLTLTSGATPPAGSYVSQGVLIASNGSVVATTSGAITHYQGGLSFSASGALCVAFDGFTDHYAQGAFPMTPDSRLNVSSDASLIGYDQHHPIAEDSVFHVV